MPKLGLTMEEGRLAEWRVEPGDAVAPGDILFVVETDKIANEIEASTTGTVEQLLVAAGETVPVGTPLARLAGAGAPCAPMRPETAGADGSGRIRATPLARRMAREAGIDLAPIADRGSGAGGRIKAQDVAALAATGDRARAEGPAPAPEPAGSLPASPEPVAMTAKHRAMVERVVRSAREVPQFQLDREVAMTAALCLRAALNGAGGPRITVTHLVLKAVGQALAALPEANRIYRDDTLFRLPASDVGMVVDTGEALFIPVLRDVAAAPLDRLAAAAARLAEGARAGTLAREDLAGGAISVSSLGMTGSCSLAPLVSPPQSAILGVGRTRRVFRPDDAGAPVAAEVMTLTLSADHRVHTGLAAARFLDRVAALLEAPHALTRTLPTDGAEPWTS